MRIWGLSAVLSAFRACLSQERRDSGATGRPRQIRAGGSPAGAFHRAAEQLVAADQLYIGGNAEEDSRPSMMSLRTPTGPATPPTRARKKVKHTEIELRKMAEKLRDIRRGIPSKIRRLWKMRPSTWKTFAPTCSAACSAKKKNEKVWRRSSGCCCYRSRRRTRKIVEILSIKWKSTNCATPRKSLSSV